jgi:TPR repeat protein
VAEYWEGEDGHPFDPKKAFHLASRGCGGGDGLACAILGKHYQSGLGTMWSPRYAIRLYGLSCNAGTGLGCAGLSEMYARGYGVAVDRAKAKSYRDHAHEQWLAACLGSEPRWCTYAAESASGRVGEPTAHELYQRACDHGIARGCIRVLHEQLTESTRLSDAIVHELDQWCSLGASAACEDLASAYDLPNGPRDPKRAAALTERACVLGEPQACVKFGILHESETGVPRDDAVARRYFNRACNRGASSGCWYLAQDTLVAGGADREVARAAQRGCQMGSIEACELLIKLYLVYHEEKATMYWATEACRMGSSTGCRYLIVRGTPLPKTIQDPVHLYREACDEKIPTACLQIPNSCRRKATCYAG